MLNSLLDVRCRYGRILRMRKLCYGTKQCHECKLPGGEHTHQSSAPTPYHAGIRQTSDRRWHATRFARRRFEKADRAKSSRKQEVHDESKYIHRCALNQLVAKPGRLKPCTH
jgi:hypothetical protein